MALQDFLQDVNQRAEDLRYDPDEYDNALSGVERSHNVGLRSTQVIALAEQVHSLLKRIEALERGRS